MKTAVIGSRTFDCYDFLKKILPFYPITCIISGGAKGADSLAKRYALERNIPLVEFLPDWENKGSSAGFLRNMQIVEACEQMIAFWDGNSPGTKNSIKLMQKFNKPYYVVWPTFEDILATIGC